MQIYDVEKISSILTANSTLKAEMNNKISILFRLFVCLFVYLPI